MDDACLGCAIWVDQENKVISFRQVEALEPKTFSSTEEKLSYVLEKCSAGFRVQ